MSHYQSKKWPVRSHFTYRRTDKRFYRELRVFAVGSFSSFCLSSLFLRNDLLSDLSKPAIENRAARTKKMVQNPNRGSNHANNLINGRIVSDD